jgi:hypothetical protein
VIGLALTIVRVLTLAAFVIALICATEPTHVLDGGSLAWTDGALLGLALSLIVPTLVRPHVE